jgi:hypothetical protein
MGEIRPIENMGGVSTTKYLFPGVEYPIGHRLETWVLEGGLSCSLLPRYKEQGLWSEFITTTTNFHPD